MIVVEVPAKPIWKKKNAMRNGVPSEKKNPDEPNRPPTEAPNITANPNTQKTPVVRLKSAKFFPATLMLFLERTIPLSSEEKPACMNITRAAATRTQAISRACSVGMARSVLKCLDPLQGVERSGGAGNRTPFHAERRTTGFEDRIPLIRLCPPSSPN